MRRVFTLRTTMRIVTGSLYKEITFMCRAKFNQCFFSSLRMTPEHSSPSFHSNQMVDIFHLENVFLHLDILAVRE